jgi:hypothetical protein
MNDTRAPAQGPSIDYLPTYRQEILTPVMHTIAAGESCSIVGVASTGKSNLFRFLLRPEVRQTYLGENWGNYLFLYIDTHSLTELSEWGLYELLLRCTVEATEDLQIESQWSELFNDLYQQAVQPQKRPLARAIWSGVSKTFASSWASDWSSSSTSSTKYSAGWIPVSSWA